MGLFSMVINRCQRLGPEFVGTLQTKELESLMDTYWLAPDGTLYKIEDDQMFDLVEIPENNADTGARRLTLPFKYVRNGKRGRVRPYRKSGLLRFTTCHNGLYLEVVTHFKTGELTGVLCKGPVFSCEMLDQYS